MSLFRCEECGCVENTACGDYWNRNMRKGDDHRALCSECSPDKGGKWHGEFDKRSANGWLIDAQGYIWHPDTDLTRITHTEIVGKVPEEPDPDWMEPRPDPVWIGEKGDE